LIVPERAYGILKKIFLNQMDKILAFGEIFKGLKRQMKKTLGRG
jgi:hypothetical protein